MGRLLLLAEGLVVAVAETTAESCGDWSEEGDEFDDDEWLRLELELFSELALDPLQAPQVAAGCWLGETALEAARQLAKPLGDSLLLAVEQEQLVGGALMQFAIRFRYLMALLKELTSAME